MDHNVNNSGLGAGLASLTGGGGTGGPVGWGCWSEEGLIGRWGGQRLGLE